MAFRRWRKSRSRAIRCLILLALAVPAGPVGAQSCRLPEADASAGAVNVTRNGASYIATHRNFPAIDIPLRSAGQPRILEWAQLQRYSYDIALLQYATGAQSELVIRNAIIDVRNARVLDDVVYSRNCDLSETSWDWRDQSLRLTFADGTSRTLSLSADTQSSRSYAAIAYCGNTASSGTGRGSTRTEASENAIHSCLVTSAGRYGAGSGVGCCSTVIHTSGDRCVALVRDPSGNVLTAEGDTRRAAANKALDNCTGACKALTGICP